MTPLGDTLRRGWLSLLTGALECAIRPRDTPSAQVAGPRPLRVLLLGGGAAAGLGVSRQDRALPGHLARHLASITGRGVDLDLTARLGMTLTEARTELERRDLTGYDAIIVAVGTADALAALPVSRWRERFELLLAALLNTTDPDTRILALGAPPSFWAPYLHPRLTRMAAGRLVEYNQVCRELCWSLPRTSYLAPLEKPSAPTTQYAASDYERIARSVAAHVAHRLVLRSTAAPRHGSDGASRRVSLTSLGLLDVSPSVVVERIVARTRAAFGVEHATVTVLRAADASLLTSAGRRIGEPSTGSDSPADAAANEGGLAITDLRDDDRFRNSSVARRRGIRFYAAHPIHAPNGRPIAVLAILDPQPRTFSPLEMAVLRDHALLIDDVIAQPHRTSDPQPSARTPASDDADQQRQPRIGRGTRADPPRSPTRAPSARSATVAGARAVDLAEERRTPHR